MKNDECSKCSIITVIKNRNNKKYESDLLNLLENSTTRFRKMEYEPETSEMKEINYCVIATKILLRNADF